MGKTKFDLRKNKNVDITFSAVHRITEMPRNYRNALQSYRNAQWKNAMPRN